MPGRLNVLTPVLAGAPPEALTAWLAALALDITTIPAVVASVPEAST